MVFILSSASGGTSCVLQTRDISLSVFPMKKNSADVFIRAKEATLQTVRSKPSVSIVMSSPAGHPIGHNGLRRNDSATPTGSETSVCTGLLYRTATAQTNAAV